MSSNNNNNSNSNNNLECPDERKSVAARIKELQVSHEGSPQLKTNNTERHISTIERSIGNASRPPEPTKRSYGGPSVSWTVQAPDRISPAGIQTPGSLTSNSNMTTPQSAPPDFSSFFSRSATDIPNINCRAHGTTNFGSGLTTSTVRGSRPQQIPINSISASNSPVEQRRPVKVINIPAGSSSGGSVSSATTQSNPRHIHMNFGDTGGICTVATPPTMQRFGSTPNISQNYRSEIRTEAPSSQAVHSSSIVLNTLNHTNHSTPERKLNTSISVNDFTGNGRRTPNPPHSLNTDDFVSTSGPNNLYSSGKLSTPVQASSPGISHSKPVFVDVRNDWLSGAQMHGVYNGTNYPPGFNPGANIRPPPHSSFLPHQRMPFNIQSNSLTYNTQFDPDFSNTAGFSVNQPPNDYLFPHNSQPHELAGFHNPHGNLRMPSPRAGFGPNSYSHLNPPTSIAGHPSVPGRFPGQTSSHLSHYTHYNPNTSQSSGTHLPKSPSIGHLSVGSRSNSQDSEHSVGMDCDTHRVPYNTMGSHGSSLSSLSSDSSSGRMEGGDSGTRSRSGSMQDDAEYVRALIQHQKRQMQRLLEEMARHNAILNKLRSEVNMMENMREETRDTNRRFPSTEDILGLSETNRQLQTEIQLFINEIDMYKSGQIPFNEINPLDRQNFFENMPTGQQESIYSRIPDDRRSPPQRPARPRRPAPPIPVRELPVDTGQASEGGASGGDIFRVPPVQPPVDSEEGESWNCAACTFSNHPALKKCEMCEMPRVMPLTQASSQDLPSQPQHQSLSTFPPRLAPGHSSAGSMHPRSGSPHPALGHQHHRAGT